MSRDESSISETIRLALTQSHLGLVDGIDGFHFRPVFGLHASDQSFSQQQPITNNNNDSPDQSIRRVTTPGRKSQEKTLEIFQRLNTPQSVVEKLEAAKYDRFFGAPNEHVKSKEKTREEVRNSYLKENLLKQKHLNLLGMPSPFPYLYKPPAPPYPLPAIEGSMLSMDQPNFDDRLKADEVPKVSSVHQSSRTKMKTYDAERLDYERKHMPFLERKNAVTAMDVLKTARLRSEVDKKGEDSKPVAQQVHEWGFRLRGYNSPSQHNAATSPALPVVLPTSSSGSKRNSTIGSKSKSILKSKSSDDFEESLVVETTRKMLKFDSDFTTDDRTRVSESCGRDFETVECLLGSGASKRVEFLLQPPHILPANRTAMRAEQKMQLVNHKVAKGVVEGANKKFGEFLPRTKFFINRGKPVPVKTSFLRRGNTFNSPSPEMSLIKLGCNPVGQEGKSPRKFTLHLGGFDNSELSFFIEGNVMSVIGEQHAKQGRRQIKRIVESVRLPDDLDLNHIIISRDYTGKVIVEELLECYDDCD